MNKQLITLSTIFILCTTACQKKDSTAFNPDNLKVSIESPLAAQSYKKGDTVFIKGAASYTTEMHGYEISITGKDSTEIWGMDEHVHGSSFSIDTFWVDDQSEAQILNLALTVEADHDGHQKTENRTFSIQ
ncbi:MAG: hypothetical protein QM743_00905 [Chitinophagaceae bacterium]